MIAFGAAEIFRFRSQMLPLNSAPLQNNFPEPSELAPEVETRIMACPLYRNRSFVFMPERTFADFEICLA